MKNQGRSDRIKKIIISFLVILTSFNYVHANESNKEYLDVTNEIEIRYKWYKEILSDTGEYCPLKDIKDSDRIDENKIEYIGKSVYKPEYCKLPTEYYSLRETYVREYRQVSHASYVLIENVNASDEVKIYYENKQINFDIIENKENQIKIYLKNTYSCDKLLFYVNTNKQYKISIYLDSKFEKAILSKELENIKFSTPDKTWITSNTKYITNVTTQKLEENDLVSLISETLSCSYSEKYVYKYDYTKEYYDDNYYLNMDGYIKDENDYRYFYKGEPITNTIEIVKEKIVKEPQIEYVYIEKDNNSNENNLEKNDSSKETECLPEKITEIKTQIVEKEISKIPKIIYVVILILTIVVFLLSIKLYKKYVG